MQTQLTEIEPIAVTEVSPDDAGKPMFTELPLKIRESRKLSKRTWIALFLIVVLIPATILVGVFCFNDRQYLIISGAIVLYTLIPFALRFEKRKPQAREIVVIAVMSAIGVVGRWAFFWVPQFKPVVAIVIITAVCFGAEAGFLTGAVTGLVSNMLLGQGPWTPWQMFAFGIIGFLAGILLRKGFLSKKRLPPCIYGGIATFLLYGGIINGCSVLMTVSQSAITWKSVLTVYIAAIPFDLIHAAATVIFLAVLAKPLIEKLDRIKVKYGLIER